MILFKVQGFCAILQKNLAPEQFKSLHQHARVKVLLNCSAGIKIKTEQIGNIQNVKNTESFFNDFRCLQSERLIPKKNKPPLLFVQNQPFSAADVRFTVRQHSQQDISSILLSSSAEKAVLFIALILSSICEGFEAPISTDVTTPSFSTQASAISARV